MLYDEFVQGTGCKLNDHNYQVYKRLELMYMADDTITKEEIYEYGKKLVDNSKSEAELEVERQVKELIDGFKEQIKYYQGLIETKEFYLSAESDPYWTGRYKSDIKYFKQQIKYYRARIREQKLILG